jgi:hypothetical protein
VISVIQKLGQEDHARTAWDKLIAQEKPVQFRKPLSEKRKKKRLCFRCHKVYSEVNKQGTNKYANRFVYV